MPNKTLYLIRHAEVGLPYRSRYLGHSDVPLSEEGVQQARNLGGEFARILHSKTNFRVSETAVGLSPLTRCRSTWDEMALPSVTSPTINPDLIEIDFGDWEGKSFQDIVRSNPEQVKKWSEFDSGFSFPGGESLQQFHGRMERLRRNLLETSEQNHIWVTHGGVASSLLCLFLGLDPSQYLIFSLARPSIATLTVFDNGLARLTGLQSVDHRGGGEWPG